MQTDFPEEYLKTQAGARANEIVRSCVHCGFCNAVCPTYQLLGNELDGPRGRIYLIKDMLETRQAPKLTRTHLDRCLTCRACETSCPSGVAYGDLLELGRNFIEQEQKRPWRERFKRRWLLRTLPYPNRFRRWALVGRRIRWLLPLNLRTNLPEAQSPKARFATPGQNTEQVEREKVLLLRGCVERVVNPQAQRQLSLLLAANHIEILWAKQESCCGALAQHMGEHDRALDTVRRNIDALWPVLQEVEVIISTASGCGVTVKDYGKLLAHDAQYCEKANRIAGMTRDVAQYLTEKSFRLGKSQSARNFRRVAWQAPCTLQHGQKITGLVEVLLETAGFELAPLANASSCCGSAGTYSLFQTRLAQSLKQARLEALTRPLDDAPVDVIASANVGCISHLKSESPLAVMHWLELLCPLEEHDEQDMGKP